MKNYSIIRMGDGYVVQAKEVSILKLASRRMAVKLVAEASELLDSSAVPQISLDARNQPSSARDRSEVS
jgi:hypothetical protein